MIDYDNRGIMALTIAVEVNQKGTTMPKLLHIEFLKVESVVQSRQHVLGVIHLIAQ